jgi:hypothetical protein
MICEYEKKVLRHHAHLIAEAMSGAAFNAATESLTESGHIRNGRITAKGLREMGHPTPKREKIRISPLEILMSAILAAILVSIYESS